MELGKRVLIAPLDWGLGHATRCIPLVRGLLDKHCEVTIASNGDALALLQNQFPQLQTVELPGYNPIYPSGNAMVWKMAFQLPKFIKTIAAEHLAIERIVQKQGIDVVISDHRYGCFSKKAKSIFITHQVHILMPEKYKWIEQRVNHFNEEQIKQYAECWVPVPGLDHSFIPKLLSAKTKLELRPIGYLSRFKKAPAAPKYDVLVICSGPEPQRTIFEQTVMEALQSKSLKYLLVRGKPCEKDAHTLSSGNKETVNFMNASELNEAINASNLVIARSGYSTVMDLSGLGKNAIFIPTPGQTEQEYIAEELMSRGIAYYMPQQKFNLDYALKQSLKFAGFTNFEQDDSLLTKAIVSIC